MPKKTKRGRAFHSKKKRARQPAVATPAAQSMATPVDRPLVTLPKSSVPVTKTKAPAVKYPYVTAELRRIGILAGAILVMLIILALVL